MDFFSPVYWLIHSGFFFVWITHILVFFNELVSFFLLICGRFLHFLNVNCLSVTHFRDYVCMCVSIYVCVCVCYIFCVNYPYFCLLYSVPRSGRSPGGEHSNPLQYSCLENPRIEEPGGLYRPLVGRESDTTEAT